MKLILNLIAYVLVAFFTISYVFNHIDPWAGIAVAFAFIAIFFKYIKPKINL